jgi:hypothetical protein
VNGVQGVGAGQGAEIGGGGGHDISSDGFS